MGTYFSFSQSVFKIFVEQTGKCMGLFGKPLKTLAEAEEEAIFAKQMQS